MKLQAAADDVADAIITCEMHLEAALASYGRLTTTLTEARRDAGLGMGYGQAMFDHLPDLARLLVEARGSAGKLHRTADAVARRLAITAGPPTDKGEPDMVPPRASAPHPRVQTRDPACGRADTLSPRRVSRFLHPSLTVGIAAWVVVIVLALAYGGPPERKAALVLLGDLFILTAFPDHLQANVIHWRTLVGDLIVLISLGLLCLSNARSWLVWAVGMQTVAVLVHVPRLLDARIHNFVYATVVNVLGFAVMAALLGRVVVEAPRHARR